MNSNKMVDVIQELIDKNVKNDIFRLGAITAINAVGARIQFDGEASASTKYYPIMGTGLMLTVNDRVLLVRVKGSYAILGKMYSGASSAYTGFGKVYPYSVNGDGLAIGLGGLTAIGGGESAITVVEGLGTNYGDEQLRLTSDNSVFIDAAVQGGFAGRYTWSFGGNGLTYFPRYKLGNTYNMLTMLASPATDDPMLLQNVYVTLPMSGGQAYVDITWPTAFSSTPQFAIANATTSNAAKTTCSVYNLTSTGARIYGAHVDASTASYTTYVHVIAGGRKV